MAASARPMKKFHEIESVTFDGDTMLLVVDGHRYSFAIADISHRLADADNAQRQSFRISPSGYGIFWPLIDEDLSVDGLIAQSKGLKPVSEETVLREDKKNFKS